MTPVKKFAPALKPVQDQLFGSTVNLTRGTQTCGHCGATDVGTYAAGYGNAAGSPLCHPNESGRPDCYRLVTTHRHPLRCRCQDREQPAAARREP